MKASVNPGGSDCHLLREFEGGRVMVDAIGWATVAIAAAIVSMQVAYLILHA